MKHKIKNSSIVLEGFSLIELMVVIVIIGILGAVGTIGYSSYISNSKVSVLEANSSRVFDNIKSDIATDSLDGSMAYCYELVDNIVENQNDEGEDPYNVGDEDLSVWLNGHYQTLSADDGSVWYDQGQVLLFCTDPCESSDESDITMYVCTRDDDCDTTSPLSTPEILVEGDEGCDA